MSNIGVYGPRPDGWLYATSETAFVKVATGPAPALLTTYNSPSGPEPAPGFEIRFLSGMVGRVVPWEIHSAKASIVGNIPTRGDVAAIDGDLLGVRDSQNWIEGFAISGPEEIGQEDISYQPILGRDWLSPWFKAGHFCGMRGMSVPLLGLRIRLPEKAATMNNLAYWASFIGGTASSLAGNDEYCATDPLAALEAMQIILTAKPPNRCSTRN